MNTNYDNEATQFEESSTVEQVSNDEKQAKKTKDDWKKAAIGAASGVLIGGVASVLMGMTNAEQEPETETESNNRREELSNPEWVDDQVQVATSVSDDMSFGEAFATARAEVGPGGCFEWHGQVYGTYTADEWNSMTAEQRAEYSDHFSWNHIDHSSSHVAQHSTEHNSSSSPVHSDHDQTVTVNDDDIEVVSVNHNDNQNNLTQTDTHQPLNQTEVVDVSPVDSEIEILGVVHDNETGANIGGMTVDGHEFILVDVDGNMEFDYMATDLNANGQFDQEEFLDIQGQGYTVNDFGGISNPTGDMLSSNDISDYSTDAVYEG